MKVLDHGFVELVSKTTNPGLSVVRSARCSYGSEGDDLGEKDRKLIKYLMGNGHTSPFRHAYFTFHVKAPLFVFRQWWKHQVGSSFREYETAEGVPLTTAPLDRIDTAIPRYYGEVIASDIYTDTDKGCSWNELSGRYKEMEPEFYVPEKMRRNSGSNHQASYEGEDEDDDSLMRGMLHDANEQAMQWYQSLLKEGVAKELARLVLPPSIYSECYWTVSLQAVIHFLHERLDEHAQWEMRQYARAVMDLIRKDLDEMGVEL